MRRNPEQVLQIAVADYLRVALRAPTIWTAFPAGGGGRVRGAFLKAMGLQAGWPDLLVMSPYPNTNIAWPRIVGLELKAAGRQSPNQRAIQKQFEDAGGIYHICRSVDEVEGFLRGVGIPLFASIGGQVAA